MEKKVKRVVLVPSNANVVVEVKSEEYKGSIIIPDTAKEKPTQGVILAVGPGRLQRMATESMDRIPIQFKVGEVVMFSKYGGTELKLDSKDLRVISEDEILCRIEEVA